MFNYKYHKKRPLDKDTLTYYKNLVVRFIENNNKLNYKQKKRCREKLIVNLNTVVSEMV